MLATSTVLIDASLMKVVGSDAVALIVTTLTPVAGDGGDAEEVAGGRRDRRRSSPCSPWESWP